jgi:hypothetical protein
MTAPCHGPFRALCALAGCAALFALARCNLPVCYLSNPGLAEARRRDAELEAQRQLALDRLRTREAIGQALAEGRMTLLQAAARLRVCQLSKPGFRWDLFRKRFPGASDEERFCRKTIDCAVGLKSARPERARAVQLRLEAELKAALRRGPLRLPEPLTAE